MKVRVCPVTGPPGAGKTTALLSLADEHDWLARFGVRDYGLDLAAAGNPLGLAMRDSLLRGRLLANDVVREEFAHFLARLPGGVQVVAVEGYPRDQAQCVDFEKVVEAAGARVGAFVVVDVPDDLVWSRVADRRICAACGRPVPVGPAPGCATCGGPVTRRGDDAMDSLAARLNDFRRLIAEVGAYFDECRLLRLVDGTGSELDVRRKLRNLLLNT